MQMNGKNKFFLISYIFLKKSVDTISKKRILNRPTRTDLQTTADGSKREREGRDEGRKRY
jgi:hypothetical protein